MLDLNPFGADTDESADTYASLQLITFRIICYVGYSNQQYNLMA